MVKTKCLGCGKSQGGFLDGFGVKVMSGSICLTCKSKLEKIPSYQFLEANQIRDYMAGNMTPEEAALSVQKKFSGTVNPAVTKQTTSADEIREYKALLDDGIITQEEFDLAKSKILGR